MVGRDRYALRTAPLLILAAAYFAAGPDRLEKVAAALDPRASGGPSVEGRIDGWIDPPTYTRMPPLVIDFAKSQDGDARVAGPCRLDLGAALAGRLGRRGATDAGAEAAAADNRFGGRERDALADHRRRRCHGHRGGA